MLAIIGFIGMLVSIIAIVVGAINQNSSGKKWLMTMGICLAIFIAGFFYNFSSPLVTDIIILTALICFSISTVGIVVIAIKQNPITKRCLTAMGICLVMFVAGLYYNSFITPTLDLRVTYTPISELIANKNNIGKQVETLLRVTSFRYDSLSKTKYLELSDDDDYISGTISSKVSVPYISLNKTYLVRGILNNEYSLNITYMEEKN